MHAAVGQIVRIGVVGLRLSRILKDQVDGRIRLRNEPQAPLRVRELSPDSFQPADLHRAEQILFPLLGHQLRDPVRARVVRLTGGILRRRHVNVQRQRLLLAVAGGREQRQRLIRIVTLGLAQLALLPRPFAQTIGTLRVAEERPVLGRIGRGQAVVGQRRQVAPMQRHRQRRTHPHVGERPVAQRSEAELRAARRTRRRNLQLCVRLGQLRALHIGGPVQRNRLRRAALPGRPLRRAALRPVHLIAKRVILAPHLLQVRQRQTVGIAPAVARVAGQHPVRAPVRQLQLERPAADRPLRQINTLRAAHDLSRQDDVPGRGHLIQERRAGLAQAEDHAAVALAQERFEAFHGFVGRCLAASRLAQREIGRGHIGGV